MSNVQPNPLEHLVAPGTVVSGKYRVERVIGVGGMGVVMEAWHLDFEERIAIKFLSPAMCTNAEAVARFEREARVLFKIKSPHVCRVLDIGKLDAGSPFLVLEFLEGEDLANRLTHRQPNQLKDAIDWTVQACDAVAEAHARGIVHRDIKPENLFLALSADGNSRIKVLDFGLSKISQPGPSERQRALTATEQSMGTPHYMSPEQWVNARDVGPETDQWALAVILYELLCGLPPFDGEQLPQVCSAVLHGPMPSIRQRVSTVPPAVERALRRALEKEPEQRFPSLGEFAAAIAPFGRSESRAIAERIGRMLEQSDVLVQSAEIARLSAASLASLRASFPGAPALAEPPASTQSPFSVTEPPPPPTLEASGSTEPGAATAPDASSSTLEPEAAPVGAPDSTGKVQMLDPRDIVTLPPAAGTPPVGAPDSTGKVQMLDPRDIVTLPPAAGTPPAPPPSIRRRKLPPPARTSSPGARNSDSPVEQVVPASPSLRRRSQTAQSWQQIQLERPSRSTQKVRRAGLIAFAVALAVMGLVGVFVAPRVADAVRSEQSATLVGTVPEGPPISATVTDLPSPSAEAVPSAKEVVPEPTVSAAASSAPPIVRPPSWRQPPNRPPPSWTRPVTTSRPSSTTTRPSSGSGSIFDSR